MYKRVMIKVSGEALAYNEPGSYNRELIETLGEDIKTLLDAGVEVSVVTGAGNFWRGARSDARVDRCASDNMGMFATAMNAIYISDCFNKIGIKTSGVSPVQLGGAFDVFNKQKALYNMSNKTVLVFAYGTGHPYFSTDTSAALYGSVIEADVILALKSGIDGVYTKDPAKFPIDALFIEKITYNEIISDTNINVMDKAAACICMESGVKTIVLEFKKGNIVKAVRGEKIGTFCC